VRDVLTAVEIERALRVAEGTEETDKAAREERCRRRARTAWDSRIPSSCHGRRDRPTAFAPVGKSDGTDADYEAARRPVQSKRRVRAATGSRRRPRGAAGRRRRSGSASDQERCALPGSTPTTAGGRRSARRRGAQMVRPNAPVLDELAQRLGVHRRASWERAPAASLNWLTPDVQTRSHSGRHASGAPAACRGANCVMRSATWAGGSPSRSIPRLPSSYMCR
jgi:hypothetical protein